jgi:hypothetical protein
MSTFDPLERLTIVVDDGAVYIGKQGYSDMDLTPCNIPSDIHAVQWENNKGVMEYRDFRQNEEIFEITDWMQSCINLYYTTDYNIKNPSPPTVEEIRMMNEGHAKVLLFQSDWAALPDITLQNQEEWNAYRVALRTIVINPPDTLIEIWPTKPEAIWA